MEWETLKRQMPDFLKKYRYAALVLIAGIALMLLPGKETAEPHSEGSTTTTCVSPSTQEQLEMILSQIQGAGKVRVLLTLAEGERTVYQTDSSTAVDSLKVETVILTDADRAQQGLILQINPPVYLGAVIVCQGADSAAVRLAVTEAVSDATGLSSDKITVLKMK